MCLQTFQWSCCLSQPNVCMICFAKEAIQLWECQEEEFRHPQPPMRLRTDDTTATTGFIQCVIKPKRSQTHNRRFLWLKGAHEFTAEWSPGIPNSSDCSGEHHTDTHCERIRPIHLCEVESSPVSLQGCVETKKKHQQTCNVWCVDAIFMLSWRLCWTKLHKSSRQQSNRDAGLQKRCCHGPLTSSNAMSDESMEGCEGLDICNIIKLTFSTFCPPQWNLLTQAATVDNTRFRSEWQHGRQWKKQPSQCVPQWSNLAIWPSLFCHNLHHWLPAWWDGCVWRTDNARHQIEWIDPATTHTFIPTPHHDDDSNVHSWCSGSSCSCLHDSKDPKENQVERVKVVESELSAQGQSNGHCCVFGRNWCCCSMIRCDEQSVFCLVQARMVAFEVWKPHKKNILSFHAPGLAMFLWSWCICAHSWVFALLNMCVSQSKSGEKLNVCDFSQREDQQWEWRQDDALLELCNNACALTDQVATENKNAIVCSQLNHTQLHAIAHTFKFFLSLSTDFCVGICFCLQMQKGNLDHCSRVRKEQQIPHCCNGKDTNSFLWTRSIASKWGVICCCKCSGSEVVNWSVWVVVVVRLHFVRRFGKKTFESQN